MVSEITPFVMDRFYQSLLKVKSKTVNNRKPKNEYLSPNLVVQVHKLMRCAFKHAVRWELMTRNPVLEATLPKATHEKREIWTVETLQYALDVCDDDILSLAINLAFSCSLRMGEMLGLTWDCIEIDEESIKNNNASIFVEKELQRVSKEALNKLSKKDVVYIFPGVKPDNKTVLLLKAPKTETSTRKVFLPQTVARMLAKRKAQIEEMKDLYGDEYTDYNLVFCHTSGRPMEGQVINDGLNKLIKEHNLPKVVFHSFRHASITYKLKWNGGDMKSVQGDSGHARMDMIANVYSHIIDEDRKYNAQRFDENFYHSQGVSTKDKKDVSIPDFNTYEVRDKKTDFEEEQPIETPQTEKNKDTSDIELLTKLIGNPEALSLLKTLAKSL